ncbi:hypothetical protein [Streptacidiphilus melanogenes]|uniref:hypothetical protein n=1 Tax=Streptacidiphilus melanogenes TaxID=411235 RepID=UPI0005A73B8A|nr:hypothetical protein [Streptacidiphilus melanogenes]
MRHTRTLAAAATVALAVVGLSACGGGKQASASGPASTASVPMASVADAMSAASKATQQYTSVSMTMKEQVTAQGKQVDISGNGKVSWKPLGLDMTMNSPDMAASLGGSTAMHMMMSGTTMYIGFTGNAPADMKGKHWMKMDLSKNAALASSLNQSNGQDPSTQVKLFTSSGDIKRVGTETINGVSTTHYSGTVDFAKLAAQQDPQLKSLIQQDSKLGVSTMNVDLWVNGQNLPVRMHEATPASSSVPMDVTIDYTDYGTTPVTVTPPAASDTLDMSSLLPTG